MKANVSAVRKTPSERRELNGAHWKRGYSRTCTLQLNHHADATLVSGALAYEATNPATTA